MNFKFGVIKKNQILASMVVLMLVVAGYLNYTYDPTQEYNRELAQVMSNNLGDTYLVDSSSIRTTPLMDDAVSTNMDDISQAIEASGKVVTAEEYFAKTRMERDNSFAEEKETYEKMLYNSSLEEEQRKIAQERITKINKTKNAIVIAENLIKLKGFQDVVIMQNEESINVVVLAEKLSEEEKKAIEEIIITELRVENGQIQIRTI